MIMRTLHLRPAARPLIKYPKTNHVFAKSCVLYQLISLINNINITHSTILGKINEKTHSYKGFCFNVTEIFLHEYSYECSLVECYSCGRT